MVVTKYTVGVDSAGDYGGARAGQNFAASGSTEDTSGITGDWRVHIQNIEIMYRRKTQYKPEDGTEDFNYIEANYTIEASREHLYITASAGDFFKPHVLEMQSDSATGGVGLSGTIRTQAMGYFRRSVKLGDLESQTRATAAINACRLPGAYNASFDTSTTVNGTIFDICQAAKQNSCPEFELAFLDL